MRQAYMRGTHIGKGTSAGADVAARTQPPMRTESWLLKKR